MYHLAYMLLNIQETLNLYLPPTDYSLISTLKIYGDVLFEQMTIYGATIYL
jgi:hypothetical protein